MSLVVDPSGAGLVGMTPPLPPLSKTEAESIAWFHTFCARHRLAVAYRCVVCFKAGRPDGCNERGSKVLTPRSIRIKCRCGVREYVAPSGTGDLATSISNAPAGTDTTTSSVAFDNGEKVDLPATILSDEEAGIVRFYNRIIKALNLQPNLVHLDCWNRRSVADDVMMKSKVDDHQIVLMCSCHVWFYQGATRSH